MFFMDILKSSMPCLIVHFKKLLPYFLLQISLGTR